MLSVLSLGLAVSSSFLGPEAGAEGMRHVSLMDG